MVETQPAGARKVSSEASTGASSLIRWGGPAAVLGAVLTTLGDLLPTNTGWTYALLYAVGCASLVVGITGIYLYLRRSGRFGLSGTAGFYLCVFAFAAITILSVGILLNLWGAQWYETLAAVEIPLILGTTMFGVAILRAGRLPRGGAWLLIAYSVSVVGVIVAMAVSGYTLGDWLWTAPSVPFTLGCVWLGYGLWSESGASATGRPSRVR